MYVSVVSKSIAPRASRACASDLVERVQVLQVRHQVAARCAAREPGTDSASHTSV